MRTISVFTRFSPAIIGFMAATALTAAQAIAGPATDMAASHIKAIGAGNVSALESQYSNDAVFQWIGGPLDGVYAGKSAISGLWAKFTKGQGKLDVNIMSIEENANGKGATVNAAVKFTGKKPIPVRYILVYRNDKLVNEIWQIDPNL